jgi:hypothetical protein
MAEIFLMNSAMTKVYAFADPEERLAIYDGRVGAALGLFVVCLCERQKLEAVPSELAFAWHDGRGRKNRRNPSQGLLKFPRLGEHQLHASNMRRASRVLNSAAQQAGCSVQDMERALFMIGYDVSEKRSYQTKIL